MDNQTVQDQAKQEQLAKAVAYEALIRSDGWKLVLERIQQKVASFTNDALNGSFKTMEEFQSRRGEVNGLRGLLGEIEYSINLLAEAQKKHGQPKQEEHS